MATPSIMTPRDAVGREFVFTDADFARCRTMIHTRAGIALSESKRDMVYSRVARRLRQLGLSSFHDYLALLDSGDTLEWQEFTNALTTNLTAFFREPHHFPLLAEHLRKQPGDRCLKLWCAAASTGEEAYSMAMTAIEAFGTDQPPVRILASDIDTAVLDQAVSGIYAAERIADLEARRLQRFFERGTGANAGKVRVRDAVRRLVAFRPVNLLGPDWGINGPLDAIVCRNVMIYFDKQTQLRVLERFAPLLRADGLLFAGHSESFHQATHLFRLRGKTVYTRTERRVLPRTA